MRMIWKTLVVVCAIGVCACGRSAGPTVPSTVSTSAPLSAATATISGRVSSNGVSSLAGVRVSVPNTTRSAVIDDQNQFTLEAVPAGDISLHFAAAAVDATLALGAVSADSTMTVTVSLGPTSAQLVDSGRRSGSEAEVEGTLTGLSSAGLTVAGRSVTLTSSTTVTRDNQTVLSQALAVGQRVSVKGTTSGDAIVASRIDIKNDAPAPMPTPAPGPTPTPSPTPTPTPTPAPTPTPTPTPAPEEVEFVGAILAKGGAAGTPNLTVGTRLVHVLTTTVVRRSGVVVAASLLAVGQTVEVEGTVLADGSVNATKVTIEDEAEVETEVEFEGAISALSGACPAVTFTLSGKTVKTTSATEFRTACTAIVGTMSLKVKGMATSAGLVTATRVEKK